MEICQEPGLKINKNLIKRCQPHSREPRKFRNPGNAAGSGTPQLQMWGFSLFQKLVKCNKPCSCKCKA